MMSVRDRDSFQLKKKEESFLLVVGFSVHIILTEMFNFDINSAIRLRLGRRFVNLYWLTFHQ